MHRSALDYRLRTALITVLVTQITLLAAVIRIARNHIHTQCWPCITSVGVGRIAAGAVEGEPSAQTIGQRHRSELRAKTVSYIAAMKAVNGRDMKVELHYITPRKELFPSSICIGVSAK